MEIPLVLLSFTLPVLFTVGVIYLIVRLAVHFSKKPAQPVPAISLDQLKRAAILLAICMLIPVFINYTAYALCPDNSNWLGFTLAAILSVLAIALAYLMKRPAVLSGGLLTGGLISLFYAVTVRYSLFSAWNKVIVVGLALLFVTLIAFLVVWRIRKVDASRSPKVAWSVLTALVIFSFSAGFIATINQAANPMPSYPTFAPYPVAPEGTPSYYSPGDDYPQTAAYTDYQAELATYNANQDKAQTQYQDALKSRDHRSFYVVFGLAFLFLVFGLLVHAVSAVSVAYIAAGLVSIIYVLVDFAETMGSSAIAAVSGVAVLLLIAYTYWKYGRTNPNTAQNSSAPYTDAPRNDEQS